MSDSVILRGHLQEFENEDDGRHDPPDKTIPVPCKNPWTRVGASYGEAVLQGTDEFTRKAKQGQALQGHILGRIRIPFSVSSWHIQRDIRSKRHNPMERQVIPVPETPADGLGFGAPRVSGHIQDAISGS